jgi:hypothetical protein
LVLYACGQTPVRRPTWIPSGNPHASYTGGRQLEVIELHLHELRALVESVYRTS